MDTLVERLKESEGKSTSEILRAFPRFEEFTNLNSREKGFWYESFVKTLLKTNRAVFFGNSDSYSNWKSSQIEGCDLKITYPNGKTEKVELKMTLGHIYDSWFRRDWESRDADIFVTNSVYDVPYEARRRIREKGKKLMSTTEFIIYVQKKMRGNKLSSLNFSNKQKIGSSNRQEVETVSKEEKTETKKQGNLLRFIGLEPGLPGSKERNVFKRKTDCSNCRKKKFCEIYSKLAAIRALKPSKNGVQDALSKYLKNNPPERKTGYKDRYKEWYEKYLEANEKRIKCLFRREHLYYKLKLPAFYEQPD